jgi:6-phosphogluconolactonase
MKKVVLKFSDLQSCANGVAKLFASRLKELLSSKPMVHISVTGGTLGITSLAAIARISEITQLEWNRVHVWWGDERFVPKDSLDRNCNQAFEALFHLLPNAILHEMPAAASDLNLDEAREIFALEVDKYKVDSFIPFDITLLGMGPDGHIASLFPGKPNSSKGASVIAEANSPKPPPERISFSYEAFNESNEVWFLIAGADKATPTAIANSDEAESIPAGRVNGKEKTVWFLDKAAASKLS